MTKHRLQMEQLLQQKNDEILGQISQILALISRLLTPHSGPPVPHSRLQKEGGGPQRKVWEELESQQKRQSTAEITSQLEELSEERNTQPSKIGAHIIFR